MQINIEDSFPKKQEDKLNIYFHVSENSGVGYYRQFLAASKIRELGLANVMINDFQFGEGNHYEPNLETLYDLMNWADIAVVGRKDIKEFYAQWGGIKEYFNMPIVLDTDDNVHFVRPTNPGYQGYHPGSEAQVWNKYAIGKIFSAITVSTEELRDFYSKYNPKIFLMPNSIDIKEWDSFESKKHDDNFIRIGFICSGAHLEGVQFIKKPLLKLMQKYPRVKFLITHVFHSQFNDFPEDVKKRIEPIPWISLKEWPKGVKTLGLDIGLAPLTDNMFNRSKSNLRFLEYSAAGIPTIASAVKPYLCIKNNKTGILVKEKDEWFNAMNVLVKNKEMRYNINKAANKYVRENFDINKNAKNWVDVLQKVFSNYHAFFGPKRLYRKLLDKKGKYREMKSRSN